MSFSENEDGKDIPSHHAAITRLFPDFRLPKAAQPTVTVKPARKVTKPDPTVPGRMSGGETQQFELRKQDATTFKVVRLSDGKEWLTSPSVLDAAIRAGEDYWVLVELSGPTPVRFKRTQLAKALEQLIKGEAA